MAVTPSSIKSAFPDFSEEDDARIQTFIEMAEAQLNKSQWLKLYDQGVLWLTAHMLAMTPSPETVESGVTAGVVEQEKVGDLSRKYAITQSIASTSNAALSSTRYGKEFARLKTTAIVTPFVVNQSGSINT